MTQKQIEQTRVIAEKDGWVPHEQYKDWFKKYRKMTLLSDIPYLTDLNALHKVAMDVIDELKQMGKIHALAKAITIRSRCADRPVAGQYIDLFNAVYDGCVFLNENKK